MAARLSTTTPQYRNMIQITIFDATTQHLRDTGLDLEQCLEMLGFRSVIIDIVIPPNNSSDSTRDHFDCDEVEDTEAVQMEKVKRKGRRRTVPHNRKNGVRRMTKLRKNKSEKPLKSRTRKSNSSRELCQDHILGNCWYIYWLKLMKKHVRI
ncbi:hypothetical protein ANCCAN_25848 [Ancylostoma caninum]|uniref:Uncharacterized protein n=1 Tax=Ancylostoma caninum TaxID=29170 RepID=A0A368FBM1_ANCCA|nr:hypothetical protein ANCCAN_25848 [Ancylostoma caninum]